MVKDANAENLLSSDNLLYIDQQTAESATVTFSYVPRENVSGAVAKIYGPEKAAQSYIPGDINDDKNVDLLDVIQLLDYVVGKDVPVVEEALNTNGDDSVNLLDVIQLLDFVVGKDVTIQ